MRSDSSIQINPEEYNSFISLDYLHCTHNKVLVVDDNIFNVNVLKLILKDQGIRSIDTALNG